MSTTEAPPTAHVPKQVSTGRFVGLIFGLIVVSAVIGAAGKNLGREAGDEVGMWVGSVIAVVIVSVLLAVFARYVVHPYTPILTGIFFGMSLKFAGAELGRPFGWWWPDIGEMALMLLGYFVWLLAIYPRVSGRTYPFWAARGERS